MKKFGLLFSLFYATDAAACINCNRPLQQAIYNSTFYPNLVVMLSAFVILALMVWLLSWLSVRKYRRYTLQSPAYKTLNPVPLTTASIILGIGMGGFVDGISLHQILQWHEMLSNQVSTDSVLGKSVNMFWDGVFHLFCWIIVFTGIILMWKLASRKDINRSGYLLSGGLLLGWGLFNFTEGLINHHFLKLHFVRQRSANPEFENDLFLGISIILALIGWFLISKRSNYLSPLTKDFTGVSIH